MTRKLRDKEAATAHADRGRMSALQHTTCNGCGKDFWFDPCDGYKNYCNACKEKQSR